MNDIAYEKSNVCIELFDREEFEVLGDTEGGRVEAGGGD